MGRVLGIEGDEVHSRSGRQDDLGSNHVRRADGDWPSAVRRSPSGRIPQWAIDEALGKLQEPSPWHGFLRRENAEKKDTKATPKWHLRNTAREEVHSGSLGHCSRRGLVFQPCPV
jgi:hypothetical protein